MVLYSDLGASYLRKVVEKTEEGDGEVAFL